MYKHIGFFLNLIAIIVFIPGILLPMFSLEMNMSASIATSQLTTNLVAKELSLLGTVEELWHNQRLLVATLIFSFSVLIPISKAALICFAYVKKGKPIETNIVRIISRIGKWSMADVFVVAVFLAVLSTNHAQTTNHQQISIFAFKIDLITSSETLSAAGAGFYYFTAYCLLSLLATEVYNRSKKPQ